MNSRNINKMVLSALLCAIGIVIPIISPLKYAVEPVSFTLGSHIAIFIAMFISPAVGVSVALGTTLGFFLGGFAPIIVMRALTHVVFAFVGAVVLQKKNILDSMIKSQVFSVIIGILHGACEVAVVTFLYFGTDLPNVWHEKGFMTSVVLLVGVGSVVHSMVDFAISQGIWKLIKANVGSAALTDNKQR